MKGDLHDMPLGFADPAVDAQVAFRAALQALSQPGEPVACQVVLPAVPGLMPATAALLLSLADAETPVWWPAAGPAAWLRFHTGAPVCAAARDATFAVVPWGARLPPLDSFGPGSDESPERSATLIVELPSFTGGTLLRWSGPGLREPREMSLPGLPPAFAREWQDNHARFPSGVDLLFICGNRLVGLPRTTRVTPHATVGAT